VDDALRFVGILIPVLWVALAIAISVFVVAGLSRFVGPVVRWVEVRYLPRVARWSRRRAGTTEDAGPWACLVCSSVNAATVVACYRCGVPRPADAPELREAATDPGVFHRPAPVNQFDPSRYRGPGAPILAPPAPSVPHVDGGVTGEALET
jgi:hypothetical protein